MMLLEKYIKVSVKKALKEQEIAAKKQEKSVYLIYKFPGLKDAMVELMSPAFPKFISDIKIIAPKPTTFKISLINGMDFNLAYTGKGEYIAKIQGKKYNLINLGESERAGQSIANMLELSFNPTEEVSTPKAPPSLPGGSGAEGNFPGSTPGGNDLGGLDQDFNNIDNTSTPNPDEEEPTSTPTPEL